MAITNPEAVAFCNQRIRVAADKLAQAYYLAKSVADEWTANNMGELIPVSSDVVEDGAATDGRHVITGNDVQGIIGRLNDLVTDYQANTNTKLNSVLAVATNPLG